MTPEGLRRLAAKRTAEAADLHSDAARLRSQAGVLEGLLDPLVSMSQRVWRGPAADEFEKQVRVHAGRVNEQARALSGVATDFDRMAGQKKREAVRLQAQAAAIEEAAGTGAVM
ncbi:MAG: hypothetical protein QNJ75_09500 [Acidimicrobiia bacterium]|nr:hypothetical protein [Acidimicrobiia bacterium]